MSKKESEIYFGGGSNMIMATSKLVTCYETLTLVVNGKGGIPLEIKIQADFDTIPEEYHEVFLNMMSAKYMKAVSFGDNPFSKCVVQPKKKWYQFWKASVNI
jgi:hypothetical protein